MRAVGISFWTLYVYYRSLKPIVNRVTVLPQFSSAIKPCCRTFAIKKSTRRIKILGKNISADNKNGKRQRSDHVYDFVLSQRNTSLKDSEKRWLVYTVSWDIRANCIALKTPRGILELLWAIFKTCGRCFLDLVVFDWLSWNVFPFIQKTWQYYQKGVVNAYQKRERCYRKAS